MQVVGAACGARDAYYISAKPNLILFNKAHFANNYIPPDDKNKENIFVLLDVFSTRSYSINQLSLNVREAVIVILKRRMITPIDSDSDGLTPW